LTILGETYTDLVEIKDATGVLGGATVSGIITLPDGTTTTPTIGNPQVGEYPIDYLTTQVGRHEMVITATSGVLGTIVRKLFRVFYVDPSSMPWLVSLADAKDYLNIPQDRTTNDAELGHFIAVASEFVEARTQSYHAQTVTERYVFPRLGGENVLILRKSPVTAVSAVIENGLTTLVGNYQVNAVGNYIWRTSGWWSSPVDVTYTVGATTGGGSVMPERVRHAVLVVLKHLWTTQRGTLPMGGRQSADDVYDPRSSYSFPRAVAEMLTDLGGASSVWVG
jgi:hypothetical protein